MNKIILTIGAILMVAGSVVYGINTTKKSEGSCPNTKDCVCTPCPCTPDCQPGDENCTCPVGCKE